jgi:hypothetical protein
VPSAVAMGVGAVDGRLTARLLAVDARGAPIAGGAHDGDYLLHGWWVGG